MNIIQINFGPLVNIIQRDFRAKSKAYFWGARENNTKYTLIEIPSTVLKLMR